MDDQATSSQALPPDARAAYAVLARHAQALGRISASLAQEAGAVSRAFEAALLGRGGEPSWAAFVHAAADLATHAADVASLMEYNAPERDAQAYFERIVLENADLLDQPLFAIA